MTDISEVIKMKKDNIVIDIVVYYVKWNFD